VQPGTGLTYQWKKAIYLVDGGVTGANFIGFNY
jgi:hypothetical protein